MYQNKKPKIYILSGKSKSGKDTVADMISTYYGKDKTIQISYAYYIKDYLRRMGKYEEENKEKYRSVLQEFGIELLGKKMDRGFLISRILEDIKVFSFFYENIIITDARLLDEIIIPKEAYPAAITIRIDRSNPNNLTATQKNHITEIGLDTYENFDYVVENDGTIEELEQKVRNILGKEV